MINPIGWFNVSTMLPIPCTFDMNLIHIPEWSWNTLKSYTLLHGTRIFKWLILLVDLRLILPVQISSQIFNCSSFRLAIIAIVTIWARFLSRSQNVLSSCLIPDRSEAVLGSLAASILTGAKLDGLTRSLAHPRWRTSEAVSNQGSVRAVAVWVGLLKWDYCFVMILGTIEQKETLKILTNIVMRSVRKMARDGLTNIFGWANCVCAPGLDRLTRLGMD